MPDLPVALPAALSRGARQPPRAGARPLGPPPLPGTSLPMSAPAPWYKSTQVCPSVVQVCPRQDRRLLCSSIPMTHPRV
eukprot:3471208-Rhodomonas_salina.1